MTKSSAQETLFYIAVTCIVITIILVFLLKYLDWVKHQKELKCKNRLIDYCNSLIKGYSPNWDSVVNGCEEYLPSNSPNKEQCENLIKKIIEG